MLERVIPVMMPDQGRSPAPTSEGRSMCRKFGFTAEQDSFRPSSVILKAESWKGTVY